MNPFYAAVAPVSTFFFVTVKIKRLTAASLSRTSRHMARPLLTHEAAAEIVGVGRTTITMALGSGRLPSLSRRDVIAFRDARAARRARRIAHLSEQLAKISQPTK